MTTEGNRVELKFFGDLRLVAAIGGAVEHFAQRVGFDAAGQKDLVGAVEDACRSLLKLLPANHTQLGVTVQDFPDRVEVTVEHEGAPVPAAAPEPASSSRVDRVDYRAARGISRMTLIKYTRAHRQT